MGLGFRVRVGGLGFNVVVVIVVVRAVRPFLGLGPLRSSSRPRSGHGRGGQGRRAGVVPESAGFGEIGTASGARVVVIVVVVVVAIVVVVVFRALRPISFPD